MNQKFDHRSDKRLITGTSGTGKTTLWAQLLKREPATRKFIYDHQGEFAMRFGVPAIYDLETLIQRTALGGYIVFDPVELFPGRSDAGFAFFCDFVFSSAQCVGGRKLFCCDELQKLTSNKDEPAELLALLDTGRRFQVDCLFISQAPNRIHNGIRNQLTYVYTFRQSDENAIKYLAQNGFAEDTIRSLPNGKYCWRSFDSGENGEGGKAF